MPILDSQSFPHLLDTVLEYSALGDLLRYRHLSRYVRDKADKLLFEHVFISIRSTDGGWQVLYATPIGTHLKFEWDCPTLVLSEDSDTDSGTASTSTIAEGHDQLGQSDGSVDNDVSDDDDQGDQSHQEDPARLAARTYFASRVKAAYIVDYDSDNRKLCTHRREDISDFLDTHLYRRHTPPSRCPGLTLYSDIVDGFSRCTLAVNCHPGLLGPQKAPALYEWLVKSYFPRENMDWDQDFVVHLLAGEGCSSYLLNSPERPDWDVFEGDTPEMKITIVGGAKECRRVLGLDTSVSDEAVRAAVDVAFDAVISQERVSKWRQAIRFTSPEAYKQEVGARCFTLETQLNPYDGVPAVHLD
jgi:hypothetical protein